MNTENSKPYLQDKADVLIALAAQPSESIEQPPSPAELTGFFENSSRFSKQRQEQILAYLDNNPQAYDRWIKQGKPAKQTSRISYLFSIAPYAIATCAALLIAGVFLLSRDQSFQLDKAVDQAYQTAVSGNDPEDFNREMASLADSLQQSEQPLSFSQSRQLSPIAQAFMLGLRHNWEATDTQETVRSHLINEQREDYDLGRWYSILWTVSQQNRVMPTDFWQTQLDILNHLQTHYSRLAQTVSTVEINTIVLQLDRLQPLLRQLAETNDATKLYRELDQTLTALRYGLVPRL